MCLLWGETSKRIYGSLGVLLATKTSDSSACPSLALERTSGNSAVVLQVTHGALPTSLTLVTPPNTGVGSALKGDEGKLGPIEVRAWNGSQGPRGLHSAKSRRQRFWMLALSPAGSSISQNKTKQKARRKHIILVYVLRMCLSPCSRLCLCLPTSIFPSSLLTNSICWG